MTKIAISDDTQTTASLRGIHWKLASSTRNLYPDCYGNWIRYSVASYYGY